MSVVSTPTAEKLLDVLGSLGYLEEAAAAARLQAAFLGTPSMNSLRGYFPTSDKDIYRMWFDAGQFCIFDEIDRSFEIEQLGNASLAVVMTKIDDPWGFKSLCDPDVALKVPDGLFNTLMSSLFAEHINHHLEANGLSPLNKLQSDKTLATGFRELITGDEFDPIGSRHDPFYAMTLLFVAEYFSKGAGFQLPNGTASVDNQDIFTKWQNKLETGQAKESDDKAAKDQLLAKYAYVWTSVLSPQGTASTDIDQIAGVLLSSGSLTQTPSQTPMTAYIKTLADGTRTGNIFDPSVVDAYRGISHRIWEKWVEILNDQSPSTFWQQGIRKAQNVAVTTDGEHAPLWITRITAQTTVNGPELAAWYTQIRTAPYMKANGALNNVVHSSRKELANPLINNPYIEPLAGEDNPMTCFVPGTVIRTRRGETPIEDLMEGDYVCTRLQPMQWGLRSCETVQNPSPKLIYGFNNEPAFFTAGHVFHTTTGLRAVQPAIARRENPWMEVGQLSIGHQLVRAVDSERYETVLIETIHAEQSKTKFVYGVHLREGLRSYHANGYLVAMNYPEITVSMIAKRLVALEPDVQLRILRSMNDLQPIFARFGAATALDLLGREAQSNSLSFGGKPDDRHEFLVRDIDLPYVLTYDDSSRSDVQIELLHGVLYIDGAFCEAASLDKSGLAWTRKLSNGQWEHAHCIFSHKGQSARGYISCVSNYEDDEEHIIANAKSFRLTPGTLVQTSHVEAALMSEVPEPAIDPSYQGVVNSSSPSMAEMAAPMAMMASELITPQATPVAMTSRVPLVFSLSYDPEPFSSNPTNQPKPGTRCGNIIVPVENNHYAFPKLRIEDYDIVRDALTAKLQAEQHKDAPSAALPTLYKHRISYDARQREQHLFELQHAQALLEASDEYKSWKLNNSNYIYEDPPSKGLHYTNLGLPASFTIAEIWQTITVEKSLPKPSGILTLTGTAQTYSMTSDGNQGAQHYIIGTYIRGSKHTPVTAAAAMAPAVSISDRDITQAHILPSPVVQTLAVATEDDMDAQLQELADVMLNQSDVNTSSQTMMLNVMQWHMDDKERQMFFNAADKPRGLPAEFTTLIEKTDAADWIKNTYAKAYMCQVLSQSDANIREDFRFTEGEKKSARYFWNGKGKDCLSRSEIYQNLDRAISRYQMRQKYSIIGKLYDSGKGVEYSNALYDWYVGDDTMLESLANKDPTSGTSQLTKICAVMDALDSGHVMERPVDSQLGVQRTLQDTNSNMLVYASNGNQKGNLWYQQYWGYKSDDEKTKALEEQWLRDALSDLVEKLLAQDPSITDPVTKALAEELEKFGKQIQGWQQMSSKMKAQQVELILGDRLPKLMQFMAKTFGFVRQGATWVFNRIRDLGGWRQNAAAVGDAADLVIGEQPAGLIPGPVAKSLLVFVGMFAVGMMMWNFSDRWSGGDAADRGIMIVTVLMGFRQLAELSIDAVYAILRYQKGVFSEAAELGIYTTFDNIMGKRLGSKWASVLEGPTGKKMMRNLSRAEAADPMGLNRVQVVIGPETPELTVRQSLDRLKEMSKVRKAFNVARRALAVIGYVLSIGLAIFLTWQLIRDWNEMDLGTRIFETIQVVLACIEGLGAAVVAGAMIAWGVASLAGAASATAIGAFAVAAASIFASFAIVIAALAVIVLIAYLIWQSKQPPPPSPLETWMNSTGKPWLQAHPAPPDPLVAEISPATVPYTTEMQTVRLSFTNKTATEQQIEFVNLTFAAGPSVGAVFTWGKGFTVSDVASAGNAKLSTEPGGCQLSCVNHNSILVPGDTNVVLAVKGPDPAARFAVPVGGRLEIVIYGEIRYDGGGLCSIGWNVGGTEDVTTGVLSIDRAKKP